MNTLDILKLTPPAQQAVDALVVEAARIEALMGDMPPPQRAHYLSNMATQQSFATLNDQSLVRDFDRAIQGAAVALLTGALVAPTTVDAEQDFDKARDVDERHATT